MLTCARGDDALLARTPPSVRLIAEAAGCVGGHLEIEPVYGYVGRFVASDGRAFPIFGKSLGLNSDAAAALAADKDYTARWLAADGLPTPPGRLVFSPAYRARMQLKNAETARRLPGPEAAPEIAARYGYPVVVKPNTGSEGRDVFFPATPEALATDIEAGFATDDCLRIEACVTGRDYRLLVLEGRVVLAYERCPLSVIGDGERPISALIADRLEVLAGEHRGAKIAVDDPRVQCRLARDGRSPETILPRGLRQPLLDNANLSTGGDLRALADRLPNAVETLATRAASSLGLTLAGVDILAPDLESGTDGATILEVNSAPGLDYFSTAAPENWSRARDIVIEMLRLRIGDARS